jgi:polar amino acid transport system substrate-binding protein
MKLLIILFVMFHIQIAHAETLKVAAIDWCPQICVNETRPGYTVELITKIFQDSEYILDIDIFPWTRAIKYVSDGTYDALLAPAKKEAPHLVFPIFPVGYQRMCFFTDVNNAWRYENKESLKGMEIGLANDTSIEELNDYIKKNPEQFHYQPYHERFVAQNAGKVLKKRIDAFIFTNNTTVYELKNEKLHNKIRSAGCVSEAEIFLAFTPKDKKKQQITKMINDFNNRMAILIKTGEINKLHQKYGIQQEKH